MTHSIICWTPWSRGWPVWWTAFTPQNPRNGRKERQGQPLTVSNILDNRKCGTGER